MHTYSHLAEKKWFNWKLRILTLSTKRKCVVNEMRFNSSLFCKCNTCTWSVVPMTYIAFFLEIFSTIMQGGPSRDTSCRNCAIEYKPGKHQLMHLTLHLGFTLTQKRLKGRDCFWVQLLGPLLTILPCGRMALCKHSTNHSGSLRKLMLDSYMQWETDMELKINQ